VRIRNYRTALLIQALRRSRKNFAWNKPAGTEGSQSQSQKQFFTKVTEVIEEAILSGGDSKHHAARSPGMGGSRPAEADPPVLNPGARLEKVTRNQVPKAVTGLEAVPIQYPTSIEKEKAPKFRVRSREPESFHWNNQCGCRRRGEPGGPAADQANPVHRREQSVPLAAQSELSLKRNGACEYIEAIGAVTELLKTGSTNSAALRISRRTPGQGHGASSTSTYFCTRSRLIRFSKILR